MNNVNHNLFSGKSLFLIGIVLLPVLIVSVIGIGFINDVKVENPLAGVKFESPFKDPYEGFSPIKKEMTLAAKPFTDLISDETPQANRDLLFQRKAQIDAADCSSLVKMFTDNPGWSLRAYVATRTLELQCPI